MRAGFVEGAKDIVRNFSLILRDTVCATRFTRPGLRDPVYATRSTRPGLRDPSQNLFVADLDHQFSRIATNE
jgi:hypothetical protein